MSQTKVDQYKKEKANRKKNVKKEKTKKKLVNVAIIAGCVILAGLLILGIVLTVKNGGLKAIKEQEDTAYATQELIEYLNGAGGTLDPSLVGEEE